MRALVPGPDSFSLTPIASLRSMPCHRCWRSPQPASMMSACASYKRTSSAGGPRSATTSCSSAFGSRTSRWSDSNRSGPRGLPQAPWPSVLRRRCLSDARRARVWQQPVGCAPAPERRQRIPCRQSASPGRRTAAAPPSARVEHHRHTGPRAVLLGSRIAPSAPTNLTAAPRSRHARRGMESDGQSRARAAHAFTVRWASSPVRCQSRNARTARMSPTIAFVLPLTGVVRLVWRRSSGRLRAAPAALVAVEDPAVLLARTADLAERFSSDSSARGSRRRAAATLA
jgi:hypothetical protein